MAIQSRGPGERECGKVQFFAPPSRGGLVLVAIQGRHLGGIIGIPLALLGSRALSAVGAAAVFFFNHCITTSHHHHHQYTSAPWLARRSSDL